MATKLDDLAMVVDLATLTEDRTRSEQRALLRLAGDVDRLWNRQTTTNRQLDDARRRHGWLRHLPDGSVDGPPCTYSLDHDKRVCVCRGERVALEPAGGWSRRVATVESTWRPKQ